MRVFVSWAHRGEGWSDTQAAVWRQTVESFATVLDQAADIDVTLDVWNSNEPELDWGRWGPRQIETSDFSLIAINEPWAQRWSGVNDPTEGAGVAGEANALHGLFNKDQREFQRRVRVVVLPGAHNRDIPIDLHNAKRATVADVTAAGVETLLADLRGTPTRQPGGSPPAAQATPGLEPTVVDDESLLLFRYRDLVRQTIKHHQAVLASNPDGYVWWGWWKKYPESAQLELWEAVEKRLQGGSSVRIGLFDSGSPTGDVRLATVSRVLPPRLDEFDDCHPFFPDQDQWQFVPDYYGPAEGEESQSCAWLCLTGIESRTTRFLGRYEFVSRDLQYHGRIIREPEQLTHQEQSLWHLRKART
ncbi:MAG: hypothetical protein ACK5KO_04630 [Arachnia sp.]